MNHQGYGKTEISDAERWHRSSSCEENDCVEVSVRAGAVSLRDSKNPDGPEISVNFHDWAVFMEIVRDTCLSESFDAVAVPVDSPTLRSDSVETAGRFRLAEYDQ